MAESFPFPIPTFFFEVTIDGTEISFQEVTGLEMSAELLEYRHGNNPNFITQKRVGMRKASTITMKKGIFKSDSRVLDKFNKIIKEKEYYSNNGKPIPLKISLLDEEGEAVMVWNVANAVPLKMSGPTLKSDTNEVAIETIEFAHEGIETSFA